MTAAHRLQATGPAESPAQTAGPDDPRAVQQQGQRLGWVVQRQIELLFHLAQAAEDRIAVSKELGTGLLYRVAADTVGVQCAAVLRVVLVVVIEQYPDLGGG